MIELNLKKLEFQSKQEYQKTKDQDLTKKDCDIS